MPLPYSNPNVYQIAQKVVKVTTCLTDIAKEEGIEVNRLAQIWALLPIEDSEGMTYLESASQCILEVSALVDQSLPNLTSNQKTALKFRVMAKLLLLKAEQLI